MLVFAASDKGGTGRSVTSCNIAYRHAVRGGAACYLDFDFGSPTAGSIFQIPAAGQGVDSGGLHSYFSGAGAPTVDEPTQIDVWRTSVRASLRRRPPDAGQLVLIPGNRGGGEFPPDADDLDRCIRLLTRLDRHFDLCVVDLSAGRSYATQLALQATADPAMQSVNCRWLVFHRWTRQHIPAAAGLAFGEDGIVEAGARYGHDRYELRCGIRFVSTAVVDPNSPELSGLRPAQIAWFRECDQDLSELAARHEIGRSARLGSVPLDPVLQWREQLLSDNDVFARDIANRATIAAFDALARRLVDNVGWEPS